MRMAGPRKAAQVPWCLCLGGSVPCPLAAWSHCGPTPHRRLLHPTVCALCADRPLDLRPGPLQAVAGGGLPAVHLLRLQHRAHQLRPLPVGHPSRESRAAEPLLTPEGQSGRPWEASGWGRLLLSCRSGLGPTDFAADTWATRWPAAHSGPWLQPDCPGPGRRQGIWMQMFLKAGLSLQPPPWGRSTVPRVTGGSGARGPG